MSDFAAICWLLTLGFWAGFAFREWGYRRADRYGSTFSNEIRAGEMLISAVKDLDQAREWVGDDIEVCRQVTFGVGLRHYQLEVKPAQSVLPLSSAGRVG